jgi:hypothetical protein
MPLGYYGGHSQVITSNRLAPDPAMWGPDPRIIGQGSTIEALSWSSALPGGDQQLTMTVRMADRMRSDALRPGRLVFAFRGAEVVWRGTMSEPQPSDGGGWDIACQGEGTYGNNLRAFHPGLPSGPDSVPSANTVILDAINRHLRWRHVQNLDAAIGQAELTAQKFENCSRTVTEALNAWVAGGALTWAVDRRDVGLRIRPLPVKDQPTRLLLTADPAGRTLNGYYNRVWLRHQSREDENGRPAEYGLGAAFDDGARDRYGPQEGYADYANGGLMSQGQADGRARQLMARFEAVSYTQEYTVVPGQVTTLGGTPVDLGMERAGEVYQVMGADQGYGGEVSLDQLIRFVGGTYLWDDFAQAARITPYQFVTHDFSSLVEAMAPPPAKPAAALG